MSKLPNPPRIHLEVSETVEMPQKGFLRVLLSDTVFHYPSGERSEPFKVHSIGRNGFDAVTIVAYYWEESKERRDQAIRAGVGLYPYVYLRSAIRPALTFRNYDRTGNPEDEWVGNQWELPAGLVEATELGPEGLRAAAIREMEEELGFTCKPDEMKQLGRRIFSCVGITGERITFFMVEVDPAKQQVPTLDGSPFEREGEIIPVRLDQALMAVESGHLPDAKTEIGLRRLEGEMGALGKLA